MAEEPRDPALQAAAAGLAEQALENLVNQFARPLDFLRELVQNSIDAGSPRVEVRARYRADEGVLELGVHDWGEGMDEEIIDNHLTRLFSSTKEDDLTRIGKFGIGFTSVFAVQPEAVLVRTGRHGQSWELLFHPDRSFDKVRIEAPIHGTQITLFKKLNAEDAETTIRDSAWTLRWWCEHTDTPVHFRVEGAEVEAPGAAADDPFAAFEAPAEAPQAELISRPLDLDASPSLRHATPLADVVIGYGRGPRFAYYNGGLTLVNTASTDALGPLAGRLGHLSFKVKSRHLEHTLTRDNVIQDAAWHKVMAVVVQAADRLRATLVEEACAALAQGEAPGRWHGLLHQELRTPDGARWARGLRERPLLRCWGGAVASLEALERQEDLQGMLPMAVGPEALLDALAEDGLLLVEDDPRTRALLEDWPGTLTGLLRGRHIEDAGRRWVRPLPAPWEDLPEHLRRLLEDTEALLVAVSGGRLRLRPVRLGGGGPLALEGPDDDRVFARGRPSLLSAPRALRSRTLLVDVEHPALVPLRRAALAAPDVSAFALAQAILHAEGEGDRAARLLELTAAGAHG